MVLTHRRHGCTPPWVRRRQTPVRGEILGIHHNAVQSGQNTIVGKLGRNDPCQCGSGRKYKLCCGALPIGVASVAAPNPPRPHAATAARQCGSCTKCCDGWVEGEIRGHRMQAGQACHFLDGGVCTIYAQRPESPCRSFVCSWLQPGSALPDDFRPDRIGVIAVSTRWRQAPALILVSAGNDPDEATLDWMRQHAQHTRTPFFYAQKGERFGYGPPEFQQEMAGKLARGERLW